MLEPTSNGGLGAEEFAQAGPGRQKMLKKHRSVAGEADVFFAECDVLKTWHF